MKIAVTSNGTSFDDQVDPRFGQCAFFLIIETETMDIEPMENSNVALGGGAGIQSAQLMAECDVKAVLTGNYGPNAFQTLNAAGVEVIVGVSGKVRDVVDQFKSGSISSTQTPNVASHSGMVIGATPASMGSTQSPAQQKGMGRGMGRGIGRGMGRGIDTGQGIPSAGSQLHKDYMGQAGEVGDVVPTSEQEADALKAQAQAMGQQLQLSKGELRRSRAVLYPFV